MVQFKKSDLISIVVLGEIVAWFLYSVLRNLGLVHKINELVPTTLPIVFILVLFTPVLALVSLYVLYVLSKKLPILFQVGKFVAVGVANTAVDFGVLNLLILVTSVASGPLFSVFKGGSFIVAVIHSYFWNKFWTFRKKETDFASRELLQFFVVSFIGLLINVGIATFVVNIIGPQFGASQKIWANMGAISATFFSMMWNFLGYKFIVFRKVEADLR